MTTVPLLPGPAVLPRRPPRLACGSASMTMMRIGWSGRASGLLLRPIVTTASRTTPAFSASSFSSRSPPSPDHLALTTLMFQVLWYSNTEPNAGIVFFTSSVIVCLPALNGECTMLIPWTQITESIGG